MVMVVPANSPLHEHNWETGQQRLEKKWLNYNFRRKIILWLKA